MQEAKNNRDRTVVLDSARMKRSLRLLRSWLRDLGSQAAPMMPLFRSNRGTRVSYDALHYQWTKPEQIVSRVLGHRDTRSTRRYAAVT